MFEQSAYDPVLVAAIRFPLFLEENEQLTDQHLEQTTSIMIRESGVTDLSLCKKMKNLTHLSINIHNKLDFTPLINLKHLEFLSIGSWGEPQPQKRLNLKSLKELTQLKTLFLSYPGIEGSIIELKGLKALEEFEICSFYQPFSKEINFKALKQFKYLTSLNISGKLTNIDFLKDFQGLKSLSISKNQLKDFSVVRELKTLKYLSILQTALKDLTPFSTLKSANLYLDRNEIEDVTPLKSLRQYKELDLSWNKISDLNQFNEFTHLERLIFVGNCIRNLEPLEGCSQLKKLDLRSNRITDLRTCSKSSNH